MSFDKIAEKKIREAMREGKFDNLPNAGAPIDLEDYFKAPEDMRMAYGVLKSAGVLPEEAEWLREIARLEAALSAAADPLEQNDLRRKIQDARLKLSLRLEQRRQAR